MSPQSSDPIKAMTTILQEHGVITDVISSASEINPTAFFSVSYPGSDAGDVGALGMKLAKSATQEEPEIQVTELKGAEGSSLDKTFTLVMTDPDAPSRADPKFGQWRHWVITGLKIPKAQTPVLMEKTAPSTTPYFGPGPPPGTGLHRYVFLLFEEPTSFSIPKDAVEHDGEFAARRNWNAMKFAEKYGLTLVGANFFLCEDS